MSPFAKPQSWKNLGENQDNDKPVKQQTTSKLRQIVDKAQSCEVTPALKKPSHDLIKKDLDKLSPDFFVPVQVEKILKANIFELVVGSQSMIVTNFDIVIRQELEQDQEMFKRFKRLFQEEPVFARLKSNPDHAEPILVEMVTEEHYINELLLTGMFKDFAEKFLPHFCLLPKPSFEGIELEFLNVLEHQNVILVSNFSQRESLMSAITKFEPYLDPIMDSREISSHVIILSQCSLDPDFICRARFLAQHSILDCFDFGNQLKIRQLENNGSCVLQEDEEVTFKFFKYPMSLMQFPIVTFGMKIHGIASRKVEEQSQAAIEDFFCSQDTFAIRNIVSEAKLEFTLKTKGNHILEKSLLIALESWRILYSNKVHLKGKYRGIVTQLTQDNILWIITDLELSKMEEMIANLNQAFELAKTGKLLAQHKPKAHEVCFLADTSDNSLDRICITEETQSHYTVVFLDRGGEMGSVSKHSLFLPSVKVQPGFCKGHQELETLLHDCDISKLPPMVAPCIQSDKLDHEPSTGDWIEFSVIGIKHIDGLQVNQIIFD